MGKNKIKDVAPKTKQCKYCKSAIDQKAKICPSCQKRQKGKGWIVALVVVLAVIGGIAGIAAAVGTSIDKEREYNANIKVEFNALDYLDDDMKPLTEEAVIQKIGQPDNIEEWNYKKENKSYPMRTLNYENGKICYEFNNNSLRRIQIHKTFEFKEKRDILPMFGLHRTKYTWDEDMNVYYKIHQCVISELWCTEIDGNKIIGVYLTYGDNFF